MDDIKTQIEKLRLLKRHYDIEYWRNNVTSQGDGVYDQIHKKFNKLINEYPEYKLPEDDILESAYMNSFSPVKHKYRMLSLGKCFSEIELINWYKKLPNSLKIDNLVFEYKIDGFAICLEYDNGILVRGSTRGDGEFGDDITQTVCLIKDIPKKIDPNFTGEISGEIYMKKSSLVKLNEKLISENKRPLKNVRNAASGIAGRKDASSKNAEFLNFLCYKYVNENQENPTYVMDMQNAKKLGFTTVYHDLDSILIDNNLLDENKIESILNKFGSNRDDLDLDIDGVVIKINSKDIQSILGEKEKIPNWSIAYKFPAQEKITTLLNVEWDFGAKDGRLTPMAVIEPVDIGGTTVKRPTLHNWDQIQKLGVKIGDTIKVSRRGDVIPHVEEVIVELRPEDAKTIEIPECPVCGNKSEIFGAYIKCGNSECSGKISGKLRIFVRSMEIESLGLNTIDKLVESEKLKSISDLYKLVEDDISCLDKMGKKSAIKILNNIENSKDNALWKILAGLSIPMVGNTTAKLLEKNFKSLERIKSIRYNELINISEIGNVVSENIISWLSNDENIKLIDELLEIGMGNNVENIVILEDKLQGSKIAFTGKLQNWTREECKKLIELNGGIPWDIKKELNILLIGDGARSNKIDKAKNLGAKIITENEFLDMIK